MIIHVLYFTVFTGIEFVLPGTSNLGVTIQIVFLDVMQHREKECNEISFPKVQENTLRSDVVPHLPFKRSEIFALFPTMCADMRLRQFPAYVEEMQSGFTRGCIEAQCPSKIKREHTRNKLFTSTVQLVPGDVDRMKANPFQGKRKIDSRWDKADYEIACQVANGSSSYEKQDSSGKLKAPHHKRFFLVATLHGASMALCQNEYANVNPTTRSAPTEFTLKECDMDLPRNKREEQQSQCSTHFSLHGQVDGVRRPLSMVVPSTAMKDYRDRRRDKCASDDEPH